MVLLVVLVAVAETVALVVGHLDQILTQVELLLKHLCLVAAVVLLLLAVALLAEQVALVVLEKPFRLSTPIYRQPIFL
jgi:hypothetical protein